MQFTKWVSIVGFCAGSIFSSYAIAQQWVMNCDSNRCLDATAEGKVQVSKCSAKDPELRNQQWDAEAPKIKNRGNGKCLDFNVDSGTVATNDCNNDLKAQNWKFKQNQDGNLIENEFKPGQCLLDKGDLQPVELVTCDANNNSQKWKWVNVGDERNGCPPQ